MWETWVRSLGQEDPLEKELGNCSVNTAVCQEDPLLEEMEAHPSILAWRIQQRSLVGYSLWGFKESDTSEQLSIHGVS